MLACLQDLLVKRYWEVSCEAWTPEQCDLAYEMLKMYVTKFLEEVLEGDSVEGVEYLTACRDAKLSFHVVADCVKLERGYLSCRYLVWEFSRYLWNWQLRLLGTTWERHKSLDTDTNTMLDVCLRLSMLHKQADGELEWHCLNDTMIDEVIYTRNRQFRLVGNAKSNGTPLHWLKGDSTPSKVLGEDDVTFVNGESMQCPAMPCYVRPCHVSQTVYS